MAWPSAPKTELRPVSSEPSSPGQTGRITREYLAGRLQTFGFEPAFGSNGWEQPLKIVGLTSMMPEHWTFRGPTGDEVSYRFLDDYMGASGLQQPKVDINDAEIVFVGYGIEAPEERWNDFKGADLQGKVLLMLALNLPL